MAAGVRRVGGRFLAPEIKARGGADEFLDGGGGGGGVYWRALVEAEAPAGREPAPPGAASAASAMAARITPAVLFVTVVLAVVLLVSGLLHVLRRLFLKRHHADGGGGAERQLQHLFFPPHEDGPGGGLDQAAIDALPEFAYGELSGAAAASRTAKGKGKADSSRPFDCAVCLCEFAGDDRLRLLPLCGHAFHAACIDVWLRSSATCPLCRASLTARALAAATAGAADPDAEEAQKQQEAPSDAASSVVLPVRLGRFKNTTAGAGDDTGASTSASPRLDGRRCYSMGSYQYVLADEHLLVSVHVKNGNAGATAAGGGRGGAPAASGDDQQGKKVYARGDSFSVSKIWQWRGSDQRLPAGLCSDDGLPWAPPVRRASTCTRQDSDT